MMIISGPCCLATTLGGKSKWSMCCQFERGSPAGEICKSSSGILCVSRVADTVNTVEEDAVSVHVQHNIAPAASRSNRILNVHSCIISSDRILAVAGIVPHQLNDMYFIMLYFIFILLLFFFFFCIFWCKAANGHQHTFRARKADHKNPKQRRTDADSDGHQTLRGGRAKTSTSFAGGIKENEQETEGGGRGVWGGEGRKRKKLIHAARLNKWP